MSLKSDWTYYKQAMIPSTPPHIVPDMTAIEDGTIWTGEHPPILVRWTTEFDCGCKTKWWYCIKDTPLNLAMMKAKKRYEITKGKRFFDVREIDPTSVFEELFHVQCAAYSTYLASYRPTSDIEFFREKVDSWASYCVLGAFFLESNILCGYVVIKEFERYASLSVLKADPQYEKYGINAVLVSAVCEKYNDRLGRDFYICDGERNIIHETAFQDYLEKIFGFRKAYCKLNLRYRSDVGIVVKILYPFRRLIKRLDKLKIAKKISAVLILEEVSRTQNERDMGNDI